MFKEEETETQRDYVTCLCHQSGGTRLWTQVCFIPEFEPLASVGYTALIPTFIVMCGSPAIHMNITLYADIRAKWYDTVY